MQVNVSAIKTYLSNPTEWFYRYHLRRVPRRAPESYFSSGSFWHSLMEQTIHSGGTYDLTTWGSEKLEEILLRVSRYPDSLATIEKTRDECERLLLLLPNLPTRFIPSETIAIEEPIESALPGSPHTLIGRPDRIIKMHNKFWHMQYKTISDRTSIPIFIATRSRDLHELAYAWLICGHLRCPLEEYGGSYFSITRKLSRKAIKERPADAFVQELIPIDALAVHDAISDIKTIASDMQATIDGSRRLIQNRDADTNRFGNVLSAYFDVFREKVSLADDSLFMDATDPYADAPPEE